MFFEKGLFVNKNIFVFPNDLVDNILIRNNMKILNYSILTLHQGTVYIKMWEFRSVKITKNYKEICLFNEFPGLLPSLKYFFKAMTLCGSQGLNDNHLNSSIFIFIYKCLPFDFIITFPSKAVNQFTYFLNKIV